MGHQGSLLFSAAPADVCGHPPVVSPLQCVSPRLEGLHRFHRFRRFLRFLRPRLTPRLFPPTAAMEKAAVNAELVRGVEEQQEAQEGEEEEEEGVRQEVISVSSFCCHGNQTASNPPGLSHSLGGERAEPPVVFA